MLLTIDVGNTPQLMVGYTPVNTTARDIIWISTSPSVASVNSNGVVTGVSKGTANIVAISAVNSAVTAVLTITVRQPYTLAFNANGGSVSMTSKTTYSDYAVGELPVPTRDYYDFLGWYTSVDGDTKVTASTALTSSATYTLYAHWQLKPLSNWVLTSAVPGDAQIIQTSWSYRDSLESTANPMPGYSQNGYYWKQTSSGSSNYASFPGGFDTNHWIYTSFMKSPYSASGDENSNTKRTVSNSWAGYVYWHWMYDSGTGNGTAGRAIYNQYGYGPDTGFLYKYFDAFTSTNGGYSGDTYYCNSRGIMNYIIPERNAYNDCHGATRWFRFDYYTSYYTDYQKIYKYYRDVSYSTTDPGTGSNISNKVKYVKYREK